MVRSHCLLAALALLVPFAAAQNDTLAVQKGATLIVTGGEGVDDFLLSDEILLADGDARLEGAPIAIMPRNGTTVNDSTNVANFTGVKKLIINLGDGSDVIDISGLDFQFFPLTLHAGDGDDAVNFLESLVGAVKLYGDDGDDLFELDSTTFGKTAIVGGPGPLSVDFDVVNIDALSITGGPEADTLSWFGAIVEGALKVNLLQGDDTVTFDTVNANGPAKFTLSNGSNNFTAAECNFGLALSIAGGPDADEVHFTDTLIGASLKLKLAAGDSNVTMTSVDDPMKVGDGLFITGGPDDDLINFASSDMDSLMQVGDSTRIKLSGGHNQLFSIGKVEYGVDVRYSGGSDIDEISLNGNTVNTDVIALLSGGTNTLNFFDTAIGDDVVVKAGSGDDTVAMDLETTVGGTQTYVLGGGNNTQP